jgi:hypothetical protein
MTPCIIVAGDTIRLFTGGIARYRPVSPGIARYRPLCFATQIGASRKLHQLQEASIKVKLCSYETSPISLYAG